MLEEEKIFEQSWFIWRSIERAVNERNYPRLAYWTAELVIHTERLREQQKLDTIQM